MRCVSGLKRPCWQASEARNNPCRPWHQFVGGIAAILVCVPAVSAKEAPRVAPALAGETWINTAPLHPADLRGQVVLIEFWTFGCVNCRNVEPYIKTWHAAYAAKGLTVIGIHSPEFDYERGREAVAAYARTHALQHPILIDDDFVNWRRFDNRAWPAMYLIDKRGRIRYVKVGEGDYERTERAIQTLLAEAHPLAGDR